MPAPGCEPGAAAPAGAASSPIGTRIILPAYGSYAGGLNVRDEAYAGLFDCEPLAVVLGRDRSWPVGWTSLAPD